MDQVCGRWREEDRQLEKILPLERQPKKVPHNNSETDVSHDVIILSTTKSVQLLHHQHL